MSQFYDGARILSLMDINGNKPEIYMVTTNRSGGKTTFFNRLCVKKFLERGEKFAVLYRYNYELDDCADKFFKDIGQLFFKGSVMNSKRRAAGIYHELYLDDEHCGYAISINSADQLKKYSHFFSDIARIIFDEFQSETNHYCTQEIRKFLSIHTSISRGGGQQKRYVPVYMLSNPVSLINPYYTEMGIASRLTDSTTFLRGDGFVLENGFVESAASAQKESGVMRAFANNTYTQYVAQSVYLNDNKAFIERPSGASRYLATIRYNGTDYALREFSECGVIYCDDHVDKSYPMKLTVTTEDHQINYVMLKKNDFFLNNMRYFFEKGVFRFKDLRCKEAVLSALSY